MSYTLDEVAFLRENTSAIDAAAADLEGTKKAQLRDVAKLQAQFGEYGRAVAELLHSRRSGKLPGEWLMDHDSAQQATPPAVAAYRAQFLRERGVDLVHDLTCSIGTEGQAYAPGTYVGSDLDASRVAMAQHNIAHPVFRADALTTTTSAQVCIADPARRQGGTRITRLDQLLPPPQALLDTHGEMAIKCAPGIDHSEWEGLACVVSLDGGVKETCLYTPGLGTGKRAVILSTSSAVAPDVIEDDIPEHELPDAGPIGRFLIDPDGAIVRAGLVRHYAAREGLHQLDPRIAYLTGDQLPHGTSGFEFIELVPMKKLKAAMAAHDVGSLEILVRGQDVDPDQLRKKLKLKGSTAKTLVVTRIGAKGVAVLCGPRVVSTEGNYAP
ncbi:SAM-dependent methyltransferase [Corynebacterium sp. HMSC05E07]|uniref:THUMP-like domain-containing protein n=1 Tax=Corynebacterium sp. HMSC05E07 TaxID=1581117 RepID=UPI0008A25C35|nr:SAM-dependent methyltransferase [Corynebacterium sp. HMSC05E07]OFT62859.1 SAM-dependent methyltransferase [Corynebacterium sp. HMSC05E07]